MTPRKLSVAVAVLFGLSGTAFAATGNAHDERAVKRQAEADYKAARDHCRSMKGNDKDVCMEQAKAQRTKAMADAKMARDADSPRTVAHQRNEKAEADYKVAKEKCDAQKGQQKDACEAEAKARYERAKAATERTERTASRNGRDRTTDTMSSSRATSGAPGTSSTTAPAGAASGTAAGGTTAPSGTTGATTR